MKSAIKSSIFSKPTATRTRVWVTPRDTFSFFQEVLKSKLDELTQGANHQGLVLTVPPFDYQTIEDYLALAESKGQPPFLLILDGIEDPHNLGSILRTADAFGVHGIIIPKRRAVGLTGIVAKTSTGAIEHVPVVRVANIAQIIELL